MGTMYGIDISKHNGNINWDAVKSSGKVDYVILRAGLGRLASQSDKNFEKNYSECKRVGLPVGAYWYSYAMSVDEARLEAKACLEVIKGKQFEYPIYFDIEEKKQFALGKQMVSSMITAFCEELENNGYFVGVYSSRSYFQTHIAESCKTAYTSWVAAWGSSPDYSGPMDMWQKSEKGSIPGIQGNVDLDECYRDFPSTIKKLGKNGFAKQDAQTKVEPKSTSTSQSATTVQTKPTEQKTTKLFDVRIICNSLNVRTGPSLSSKAVGIARNGEIYPISEEKNGWGKIQDKDLWISMLSRYVKKF